MSEIITLNNGAITASFSTLGAETLTLADARSGRQYLWRGDKRWWGGHSPILFPATGALWNGTAHIDGIPYAVPKHGFAQLREWSVVAQGAADVTFRLVPQAGDETIFPYSYVLLAHYQLQGRRLQARLSVENTGSSAMYFQLGGHPGLELPEFLGEEAVNGFLQLASNPGYVLRAGAQGCLVCGADGAPAHFDVPLQDGLIPLSVATFANEALIFSKPIGAATLLDKHRHAVARVESTAPAWLFWSQQGVHCPFVCCEPWYGLPDRIGFSDDISQRPFVQSAQPGETWEGGYAVEVM